jgi:hypothetical protein
MWRPCEWPGCTSRLDIVALMSSWPPPDGWVTLDDATVGYLCGPHAAAGHRPRRIRNGEVVEPRAACECGWVAADEVATIDEIHEQWRTHVRPVWLLDVDDVVNADDPGWGAAPFHATVFSPRDRKGYRVRWAPELLDRIRRVQRAAVEVVWCSTWCNEAELLEDLWGLPRLRRAFDCPPPESFAARWDLKVSAAVRELEAGRRVIWTDNDLPKFGPGRERFEAAGVLLIAPRPDRGLQPGDMDAIEAFAHVLPGER